MINVDIICVGRIKEKYWDMAIAEYSKRLSRYCKLNIIELEDEKTPDNAPESVEEQIKAKEGERILKKMDPQAFKIALAIQGEKLDSVKFSKKIQQIAVSGKSRIQFVIGGSLGLAPDVIKATNYQLSFSDMTFPHQLMRVVLLEQIYRGFKITSGEPYHK